jgi:hypothetical protein
MTASREWAAIGEVAPLLLAAGTPKAPYLRIYTLNANRFHVDHLAESLGNAVPVAVCIMPISM